MPNDQDEIQPLSSAPLPPLHSMQIFLFFSLLCLYLLPNAIKIDAELAHVETFTRRVFPHLMSVKRLARLRLGCAAIIWTTTLLTVLGDKGTQVDTFYLKGSRLLPTVIYLKGVWTLLPVTALWWVFLGISFSLSGYISWRASCNSQIHPYTLRAGVFFWNIAAPLSMMVSAIVRYVIWTQVLINGGDTYIGLKDLRSLVQHNFNIVAAMTEMVLLGGLPVRWSEAPFVLMTGQFYYVFSVLLSPWWDKTRGPQFIYFFFDTTLPGFIPSVVMLGLLAVLLLFLAVFAESPRLLELCVPRRVAPRMLFVLAVCSTVMRFRD